MKNGISLLILVITVLVMVIITSTVFISYNSTVEGIDLNQFAKEMYQIETLVENYEFIHDEYPLKDESVIVTSAQDSALFDLLVANGEVVTDGNIVLNEVDLTRAGVAEVSVGTKKQGNLLDVYAYSSMTNILYYLDGFENEDITYYMITAELYDELGIHKVD